MNPLFWKDRNVLITGHTGFKGSWLSLWLQRLGARVTGYSLPPPSHPSLYEVARVQESMRSVKGDVRDLGHLLSIVSDHRPEIIIHMAAQALVRRSYQDPVGTYATNIMGTVNILEAARRVGSARVMIIVTSDKCYENREWLWGYRENDPMGGNDPYSSSKGCAELVTAAYRRSFFHRDGQLPGGMAVATARAGNVIGGGDWAEDRIVPDVMNALLEGRPAVVRRPDAVRPWQYVLEPLHGYLRLAEYLWEHGPECDSGWNFGPHDGEALQVRRLVGKLTELWGDGAGWTTDGPAGPPESHYLRLDCSKARNLLNWSMTTDLPAALGRIVSWYRAYQRGEEMRRVTEEEIASFEEALREEDAPAAPCLRFS